MPPRCQEARLGLMLSLESQRAFQNLLLFCFRGKQNSLLPSGPVINVKLYKVQVKVTYLLHSRTEVGIDL